MDRVASLHADILTMDKTVSQNVCVMRRSVIISRGVNRKVMLILSVCKVTYIELKNWDTKKKNNKSNNDV